MAAYPLRCDLCAYFSCGRRGSILVLEFTARVGLASLLKPNAPVLRAKDYEVRPITQTKARELVEKYHYAKGGSNTATHRHGLFLKDGDECLGVAWWLPPTKDCAIANYPEGDWQKVVTLSRLVLLPEVAQNGASYLMGSSIRKITKEGKWECLLTYADTWRGHGGAIYKATNWEYKGLTKPSPVWVDQDGRMVARKAGPKTRTKKQMEALGYTHLGDFPKHKYRMLLPKVKEKYNLFG